MHGRDRSCRLGVNRSHRAVRRRDRRRCAHRARRRCRGRRAPHALALGAGLGALAVAAVAFFCAIAGVALGRAVDAIVAVVPGGRHLGDSARTGSRRLAGKLCAAARVYHRPRSARLVRRRGGGGAGPCHPLVRIDELGEFVLDVPASSGVARSQKLAAGARATVQVGGATFHVANVPAPRRQAMPQGIDWTREVYLGGVTLVVSAFLFLVYSIPPSPQSLALDLIHGEHFARFVIVPPQEPPPPPMPGPANDSAAAGHAAREKAGTLGKTTAKERTGVLKLPGPVSREKVMAAAQTAAQTARHPRHDALARRHALGVDLRPRHRARRQRAARSSSACKARSSTTATAPASTSSATDRAAAATATRPSASARSAPSASAAAPPAATARRRTHARHRRATWSTAPKRPTSCRAR